MAAQPSNPPQQRFPTANPPPTANFPPTVYPTANFPPTAPSSSSDSNRIDRIASSLHERLNETISLPEPKSLRTIFKVPDMLYTGNEKAFTPDVVSIGPSHHKNTQLQKMEYTKLGYMKWLIFKRTKCTVTILQCLKAVESIEEYCLRCYEIAGFRRDEFIEMMVIDGSFILEFLIRYMENKGRKLAEELQDDPVFRTPGKARKIIADLIQLENQIPMSVLNCLFNLVKNSLNSLSSLSYSRLDELLCPVFMSEYRMCPDTACIEESDDHLLDWLRNCLVRSCTIQEQQQSGIILHPFRSQNQISSVTRLLEFGVRFKRAPRDQLLNIKFEDGTIIIPSIDFEQNTRTLFRNLIAFENCCPRKGLHFTSYAVILGYLIKSPADALHLNQEDIIEDGGNNEEIASFLNSLRYNNDTSFRGFLYSDLNIRVKKFQSGALKRYGATVKRDYCQDPIRCLGFLLAIVVGLYTILPYWKQELVGHDPN